MDFTKLWDKKYLLGPNPLELSRSDLLFFWVSLIFLAAALVLKLLVVKKEKGNPCYYLFGRLFHLFLTIGLLVLLWVGARFENIVWLSTHIVVISLFLIGLVWLGFIGKYFIKDFSKQKRFWEEEKLKQKYLAKK